MKRLDLSGVIQTRHTFTVCLARVFLYSPNARNANKNANEIVITVISHLKADHGLVK
jgi:hypothetical protein